jgi:hypothetical protein
MPLVEVEVVILLLFHLQGHLAVGGGILTEHPVAVPVVMEYLMVVARTGAAGLAKVFVAGTVQHTLMAAQAASALLVLVLMGSVVVAVVGIRIALFNMVHVVVGMVGLETQQWRRRLALQILVVVVEVALFMVRGWRVVPVAPVSVVWSGLSKE